MPMTIEEQKEFAAELRKVRLGIERADRKLKKIVDAREGKKKKKKKKRIGFPFRRRQK